MKTPSITLSPAVAKRLGEARESLYSALTTYDAKLAREGKLLTKLDSLNAAIGEAEARLDPLDDDAVLKLTAKRTQRDAVAKSLENFDDELNETFALLAPCYSAVQRVVGDAHRHALEKTRGEALAAVLPYFGTNERLASDAVATFPCVRQLQCFCGNAGVSDSPNVEQARRLLAMTDSLLAGKSSFVLVRE